MKMLISIVDRTKCKKVSAVYANVDEKMEITILGEGTVTNDMKEYVGLNDKKRSIVIGFVKDDDVDKIFEILDMELHFSKPNEGIAIAIDLREVLKWN